MKIIDQIISIRRIKVNGGGNEIEYWTARELLPILGYDTWQKFEGAIARAIISCRQNGRDPNYHFTATGKMITVGKGAQRSRRDYYLSRYACYLISMNGDSSKPEIASIQNYFAVQARRQELTDQRTDEEKRLVHRRRVINASKQLHGAARKVGVVRFGIFYDGGYKGMYTMSLRNIKQRKRIPESEDLLDCCGRVELAAHEFRITQTEQRLKNKNIQGEENATQEHFYVGREVRNAMGRTGGAMPEDLPPEPSIRKLLRRKASKIDEQRLIENFTQNNPEE